MESSITTSVSSSFANRAISNIVHVLHHFVPACIFGNKSAQLYIFNGNFFLPIFRLIIADNFSSVNIVTPAQYPFNLYFVQVIFHALCTNQYKQFRQY